MFDHHKAKIALFDVAHFLDSLEIPFFLLQGTALGAYRDKQFVPHEKDIDIGILQENLLPHVGTIIKNFVDLGCEVESWAKPFDFCRTLVIRYNDTKIDIVGMLKWGEKRYTACPVHPSIKQPYAIVHDAQLIENYQQVEMFDKLFNVPSPIEDYLQLEYGPDWRTPKDDHISRTRVYDFLRKENVQYGPKYTEHTPHS